MKALFLILLALLAVPIFGGLPTSTEPAADFVPLKFLVGRWEADSAGAGRCEFTPEAQGKILVRRNHGELPAANGRPASIHDDLMVIYHDGTPPRTRADYYDSEGHVIRYAVETSDGQAVFLSDLVPGGPRFRLTYMLQKDGAVAGRFEISPPGAAEAFKPYLTWVLRRAAAGR